MNIKDIEFLGVEEERLLTERALAGDFEARNRVVMSVYPWIVNRANVYQGLVPREDLVNHAVAMCIEKFHLIDLSYKNRPKTYLTNVAERQMQMMVSKDGVIATPGSEERLKDQYLEPTVDKLRLAKRVASFSMPISGESTDELGNTIADRRAVDPGDEVSRKEEDQGDRFYGYLSLLPEKRDRAVMYLRIIENRTLRDIGAMLGLSKERVRQIEYRAIQKLREFIVDKVPVPKASREDVWLPEPVAECGPVAKAYRRKWSAETAAAPIPTGIAS